jgi:hypothetical protein
MITRRNYIPNKDREFLVWISNLLQYLMARVTKFKYPQDDYDLLDGERNTYAQKLDVSESPATRTPVNVKSKNIAKRVLEKHIRKSVKSYLIDNPLLTEDDLTMLGLPVHKTTRTPAPVAGTAPDFDINSNTICHLIIHFFEKDGDHKKAKPAGQHGVEIRWMISDVPMVDANEFTHSSFDTHTPLDLEFSGHDRGKTVYLAARWENTRGLKGPWSPIQSTIIP